MASATNLRLKGTRFHFRRKIPYNLRTRFGRSEIVRSLQTGARNEAAARSRQLWLQMEKVFSDVLQKPDLTREQIDGLVARAASDLDWAREIRLAESGTHFDHHGAAPVDADAIILEEDARACREEISRNDMTNIRSMVRRYCSETGLEFDPDSIEERMVGRAFLRLVAENSEKAASRVRDEILLPYPGDGEAANHRPLQAFEMKRATSPAIQLSAASQQLSNDKPENAFAFEVRDEQEVPSAAAVFNPTFSSAWHAVIGDLSSTKQWDKGRIAHAESSRRLWIGINGDTPLLEMTRQSAIAFRATLSRLPDRYSRDARWRNLKLSDIVDAANATEASDGIKIKRMSTKTVNRHISELKQMWLRFESLELAARNQSNPFDRLHISVKKSRVEIREERDQFTIDELQTLFGSAIWTGSFSDTRRTKPGKLIIRDWKFWIPLIGAYSGMRREEICSLEVGDFEQVEGIWIVNLRKAKKRLKTTGSARYVPIHRNLLAIGIVADLVANRNHDELLFPELKPSAITERRGEPFGKWFTPLRKSLGIYREEVVFHSFRHTVSTALHNAAAHEPFIEEIIGHESEERKSEIKRYTKTTIVKELKATLDHLDYGLDHSLILKP